jgi:type IV secretory pathway VirJ component
MTRAALVAAFVLAAGAVGAAEAPETMAVPGFGKVVLYAPDRAPEQVVLFLSGDGGWNLGVVAMAERLRDLGALVVGIDTRAVVRTLEASKRCAYPAGALEELSRAVQVHRKLPAYRRPILVGYSSGATLAYAALAAAPRETFAGAISLGFCPGLEIRNPPCRQRGLAFTKTVGGIGYDLAPFAGLAVPWMVLQGDVDQVCDPAATRAFVAATGSARLFALPKVGHGFSVARNWDDQYVAAYRAIAGAHPPETARTASAAGLEDLALVEVPAAGPAGDAFAIVATGDGGWADIDESIAAGLAARGVPVVGWSSLRYYWAPRTPEGAAADLARIVDHYAQDWNKRRVLLVGYSFGADVLPFLVNRLPPPVRGRVAGVTLLGLSDTAAFEFHVTGWLGGGQDPRHPTAPEVAAMTVPVTCVHGADEEDSACRSLKDPPVRVVAVGHGHHFDGLYGRLVDLILAPPSRP